MNQAQRPDIEGAAISALAAASKTPFKTAFLVTLGIGSARLLMGLGFLAGLATIIVVAISVLGK